MTCFARSCSSRYNFSLGGCGESTITRRLTMPDSSLGMKPQDASERQRFEREVKRIVAAADAAGLTLRLLGSLAFQTHCPRFGHLQAQLGRAYTDIDLASYGSQAKAVSGLMVGLGYTEDREIFVVSEGNRAIFEN